jgi:CDP-glucose 4,6-dehydratase
VIRGQQPVIRSDGKFIRDYFYVEDGAAAYMLLAEKMAQQPELRGQAFNFSNELQITVLDLVAEVLRLMDVDVQPRVMNQASHEIRHQYLSAEKARTLLGWRPLFTLDQGLRLAIDWYRNFFEERPCRTLSLSGNPDTGDQALPSHARAVRAARSA